MNLINLYTSFNGRINRQPYWIGTIILVVLVLVISWVVAMLMGVSITAFTAPDFRLKLLNLVLGVLVLCPAAALMVKRLHDRDRPASLAALFLAPGLTKAATDVIGLTGNPLAPNVLDILLGFIVPIVGIWALIELGCLRGSAGTNQHGPDPLSSVRD